MRSFGSFFLFWVLCLSSGSLFAQYATLITVAADGTGDHTTIQAAIDDCKSFPDKRITILVKNGVYHEKVTIHAWNTRITLRGESRDSTVITFGDYFDSIGRGRNSTFWTPTLHVQGNDFRMEHITVVNSAGPVGQAVALSVEADRCAFVECGFKGFQDTVYVAGEGFRHYFLDCHIEGSTDFIFGAATAVFESCTIHSLSNSYVTAASTFEGTVYGLVFLDCDFTAEPQVAEVYLGRPWRAYARTVLIRCELGEHILPAGWHNWNDSNREKTTFYGEYNNSGPGSNSTDRVSWSHTLKKRQAARYTPQNILGEWAILAESNSQQPFPYE